MTSPTAPELTRVQPLQPMSRAQEVVCDLLAMGLNKTEISVELRVSPHTVVDYIKRAARKIPGNLPAQLRCIAWARGATEDVLTGRLHQQYVVAIAGRSVSFNRHTRPRPR